MSTPLGEPPAPKKRSTAKKVAGIGCLSILGLFVLLVIIGVVGAIVTGADGTDTDESSSPSPTTSKTETATPAKTTAAPSPTPEATTPAPAPSTAEPTVEPTKEPTKAPAKTEAPKDPLGAVTAPVDGAKAHMEGPVLFVQIPLQEGFSGPSTSVAQKDTVDVLKAVQESGVDYTRVFVQGDPEKGGLGMLNAGYDKATVDSIDFSTVVVPEIWNARDAGNVSAELQ